MGGGGGGVGDAGRCLKMGRAVRIRKPKEAKSYNNNANNILDNTATMLACALLAGGGESKA